MSSYYNWYRCEDIFRISDRVNCKGPFQTEEEARKYDSGYTIMLTYPVLLKMSPIWRFTPFEEIVMRNKICTRHPYVFPPDK